MAGEGLGKDGVPVETPYDTASIASVGEFIVDTVVELSDADIDRYRDEDWFPAAEESLVVDAVPDAVREQAEYEIPGGKAPNQAVAAARAGGDATVYGGLGADTPLDELEEAGVAVAAEDRADRRTGRAYVFREADGDNRIACDFPADPLTDEAFIEQVYADVAEHDYVLLTNGIETEAADALLDRLEEDGYDGDVILDPSPLEDVERLLDHEAVSYVTPNEHEYAELEDALDEEAYTVIRTTAEGAYMDGELHPAPDVEPVDTTAAGDTLNGYLAAGLAEGYDESEALQQAVEAASVAVTHTGPQPSIPDMEEVDAVLEGQSR